MCWQLARHAVFVESLNFCSFILVISSSFTSTTENVNKVPRVRKKEK